MVRLFSFRPLMLLPLISCPAATAHISEEVKKAAVAAPVAIVVAVASTGIFGWVYNIVS